MPRIMAKAVYSLTTPDGREVGTIFETYDRQLVLQLNRSFHESAREEPSATPRLVIRSLRRGQRCG